MKYFVKLNLTNLLVSVGLLDAEFGQRRLNKAFFLCRPEGQQRQVVYRGKIETLINVNV